MKKVLTVPERHQRKIALDTLKMSEAGASIMGGMDHRQAVQFLLSIGYGYDDIAYRLRNNGHDAVALAKYMAP
jgi:hypothetical protein